MRRSGVGSLLLLPLLVAGCLYGFAGGGFPAHIRTIAILPFSATVDIFGTDVGLYGVDPSVGILYAFAFGAIAFYGLMLGGWASGSKYSFLGAMRGAAQLISYEVAQGLSLVGVIMMAGTLSLTEIVTAQEGLWYIVPQFVGFVIFLIAGLAQVDVNQGTMAKCGRWGWSVARPADR